MSYEGAGGKNQTARSVVIVPFIVTLISKPLPADELMVLLDKYSWEINH